MHTVYKYPIKIEGEFEVEMPTGARLLSVQVQNGQPCIWALVDPEANKIPRYFRIFGTGHPINEIEKLLFVGTFQCRDGALVFHLFEKWSPAAGWVSSKG